MTRGLLPHRAGWAQGRPHRTEVTIRGHPALCPRASELGENDPPKPAFCPLPHPWVCPGPRTELPVARPPPRCGWSLHDAACCPQIPGSGAWHPIQVWGPCPQPPEWLRKVEMAPSTLGPDRSPGSWAPLCTEGVESGPCSTKALQPLQPEGSREPPAEAMQEGNTGPFP